MKNKVYDCFTFFNENDILDLRINILKDIVDKFIVIEASKTHAGKDKPFNFDKQRFSKYQDKIIYFQLTDFPEFKTSWTFENYQRNYIQNVLEKENCNEEDIILISDVDEIISPNAIKKYIKSYKGICSLNQKFFYYHINQLNITESDWKFPKILRFKDISTADKYKFKYNEYLIEELNSGNTMTKIRFLTTKNCIKNGGWHFSYLGGVEKIVSKLQNFSHQEFNNSDIVNAKVITQKIKNNEDILNRGFKYQIIPITRLDYPKYIMDNKYLLQEFIVRTNFLQNIFYFADKLVKNIFSVNANLNRIKIKLLGIKIAFKIQKKASV